jgi:hypothetical protein
MLKHNLNGPAQIKYRLLNGKILIESVSYFKSGGYYNKKGPSLILLNYYNKICESFWDYSDITINKIYNSDGSVHYMTIRKKMNFWFINREYHFGEVRDNIVKEYNKMIPKIEELFRLAGKDYKINEVL